MRIITNKNIEHNPSVDGEKAAKSAARMYSNPVNLKETPFLTDEDFEKQTRALEIVKSFNPAIMGNSVQRVLDGDMRYINIVLSTEPKKEERAEGKFKAISAKDFADAWTPGQWFIEDIIPKAGIGMIYGASGSGKSFFAIDMMMKISKGNTWRGIKTEQVNIVYVAAEGANGIRKRLKAYSKHFNEGLDSSIQFIDAAPDMANPVDVGLLCECVSKQSPSIIVIDTFACVSGGLDENSSSIGRVVDGCKQLSDITGALVILIHHSGKDESKGARGHSLIRAAMDFEICVEGVGFKKIKKATISKQKDGEDGKHFPFKLERVVVHKFEDGKEESSCIVNHDAIDSAEVETLSIEQDWVLQYAKSAKSVGRTLIPKSELVREIFPKIKEISPLIEDKTARDRVYAAMRVLRNKNILNGDSKNISLPVSDEPDRSDEALNF